MGEMTRYEVHVSPFALEKIDSQSLLHLFAFFHVHIIVVPSFETLTSYLIHTYYAL